MILMTMMVMGGLSLAAGFLLVDTTRVTRKASVKPQLTFVLPDGRTWVAGSPPAASVPGDLKRRLEADPEGTLAALKRQPDPGIRAQLEQVLPSLAPAAKAAVTAALGQWPAPLPAGRPPLSTPR